MVCPGLTLGSAGQPDVRGRQPGSGAGRRRVLRPRALGVCTRGSCRSRGELGRQGVGQRLGADGKEGRACTCALHQEEKQAWMLGLNTSWEHVSAELQDYVLQQEAQLEWTLGLLRVLLSCTFLLVFRT